MRCCSYERIKRSLNNHLSYWFGSEYSDVLHKAVVEEDLKKVQHSINQAGIYVDSLAWVSDDKILCNPEESKAKVTPLHLAAKSGSLDIAKFLLKKGANPNQPEYQKSLTPFHYALYYGHYDLAKYMVQTCNVKVDPQTLNIVIENGLIGALPFIKQHAPTLLRTQDAIATHKRDEEIKAINWFCQRKNIEAKGMDSWNSTYFPFETNDDACQSKALLALRYSTLEGEVESVKGLLKFEKYFTKEQLNAPLYDIKKEWICNSIREKFPALCKVVESNAHDIDGGVSSYISVKNTRKAPILFLAILSGKVDSIKPLIDHGANIDATVNGISARKLIMAICPDKAKNLLSDLKQSELKPFRLK